MSILFLIVAVIGVCIAFTLYFIGSDTVKPAKLSYTFLALTVVVWACFLTGVFTLFPDKTANILWESSWIGLLILGFVTFIYEFKNSKAYAFSALIICFINGSFYMFAKLIASM
ncbi:hypothetical protein ACTHOQ_01145 [Solibacillus silvestris]|uniref:hypothetical protein n=1 Tax=Solibacillus silvestris TaxID=76853 RepID=UPI003F7FE6FC